ncbi:Crp/Fnr family transcriptional regulator, partial [Pseudomonadota bacterium]
QGCFLAVNLVNLLILLFQMRATHFDEDENQAYQIKFSDLKPHEVRPIFKYADRITTPEGGVLLSEGESNESLYLILGGECRVMKSEVTVLRPGQFVGELSFISDEAVSADVISTAETRLMAWDKKKLEPLFKHHGLYEAYFYSLCSLDVAGKLRAMTVAKAAG